MNKSQSPYDSLPHISEYYDNANSQVSALHLILTLRPDWRESKDTIEFVRFTDGITNTLLKAVNKLPGLSKAEVDEDAILLRAYGKGTDVLIDREKETRSHCLLARHGLAPFLYARFENGLLYKFVPGSVCSPADLRRPDVWRGVAQRLGEWHATLPISSISSTCPAPSQLEANNKRASLVAMSQLTPGKPVPNVWTTMQKWIDALPTSTTAQTTRREHLSTELASLTKLLGDTPGVGGSNPFVFAHCDLLSGNVIIEPSPSSASNSRRSSSSNGSEEPETAAASVSFIDYEYSTPAPAAFDIANHFAEWGGFDCDYNVLPTRRVRRSFLREYLHSTSIHLDRTHSESDVDELFDQVDRFRGVPGFYWGIWALIQAQISLIDFDYASYAEIRLGEYYAWQREVSGEREKSGEAMPLREQIWAKDE
jgi:ethanolamine kinase